MWWIPFVVGMQMPAFAADTPGEDLVVDLVTFGPGTAVEELFGHSALVVTDKKNGESRLYNYGEFAFTSTTVLRYAAGHLTFFVGERIVENNLELYKSKGRSILAQTLALTPSEKKTVAALLSDNVKPENRKYQYDHFLDNCTTRPRDILDKALHGQLSQAARAAPPRMSLRDHVRRMAWRSPAIAFVLDLVGNGSIDRPIQRFDELFLPSELEQLARTTQVTHDDGTTTPLVASEAVWFAGSQPAVAPAPPSSLPWLLALGGVLAAALFVVERRARAAAGLAASVVLGIPGLVLLAAWLVTEHTVAHHNANLLVVSPLALLALPLGVAARGAREPALTRWRALWVALLACLVVAVVLRALGVQHNEWQLALFGPSVALLGAASLRALLRSRRAGPGSSSTPASADPPAATDP